ncbi:MAG TPA: hypothetical protein VFN31_02245 [Candidatus Saccharimonadales bacterium]|nr:hypothetical protein [Candidatus Saccharimonadales bacterium]
MSNQTDAAQTLKNLAKNSPKPNANLQNPKSLITKSGQVIKLNEPPKTN